MPFLFSRLHTERGRLQDKQTRMEMICFTLNFIYQPNPFLVLTPDSWSPCIVPKWWLLHQNWMPKFKFLNLGFPNLTLWETELVTKDQLRWCWIKVPCLASKLPKLSNLIFALVDEAELAFSPNATYTPTHHSNKCKRQKKIHFCMLALWTACPAPPKWSVYHSSNAQMPLPRICSLKIIVDFFKTDVQPVNPSLICSHLFNIFATISWKWQAVCILQNGLVTENMTVQKNRGRKGRK